MEWDDLLSFFKVYSASILSICAIFLTIQQSWLTRRHNRLSVRPMLAAFSQRNVYDNYISVESTLYNNGLGPAFIKSFEYLIDGVPVVAETTDDVREAIQRSTTAQILESHLSILRPKHVMGKESSQQLAHLTFAPIEAITHEELERYQVRIVYESAYGETFTYDSRDHTT